MSDVSGDRLKRLIRHWILAEVAFRIGPMAYTAQATEWLSEAEGKLRRAVTGCRRLEDAYEVLRAERVSCDQED